MSILPRSTMLRFRLFRVNLFSRGPGGESYIEIFFQALSTAGLCVSTIVHLANKVLENTISTPLFSYTHTHTLETHVTNKHTFLKSAVLHLCIVSIGDW